MPDHLIKLSSTKTFLCRCTQLASHFTSPDFTALPIPHIDLFADQCLEPGIYVLPCLTTLFAQSRNKQHSTMSQVTL